MESGYRMRQNGFELTLAEDMLHRPYKWKKPRTIFVNSMSDLFHKDLPVDYIKKVFDVMNNTPHTYQILTKRAERLAELAPSFNWTTNIWMGVSVENEEYTCRIPFLASTPAHIKFLSVEPVLGPVHSLYLGSINWVIVGGESGHGARPIEKEWVEEIRRQCQEKAIPFFLKQWGGPRFNPDPSDPTIKKGHPSYAKGGCQLDGKVYREMPKRMSLAVI